MGTDTMKIDRILVIALTLLVSFGAAARNRAVLIGVSEYPEGSGWCRLSSRNDIALLRDRLGDGTAVTVLEDAQATRLGIVQALRNAVNASEKGDTVFVHFSGHGQQMMPSENDDLEVDGLDEAIIPYDAKKDWSPSYDGRNHLRDDEFSDIIDDLRRKLGPDGLVIVSLDACHSDSMDKDADLGAETGGTVYRGTSDVFGENVTDEALRSRYRQDTSPIPSGDEADVVYISACKTHSRNAEITLEDGTGYGSLSYAVAEALASAGIKNPALFIDSVVVSMDRIVPYQEPGVRTSFEYAPPEIGRQTIPVNSTEPSNHKKENRWVVYALLAMMIFGTALWIMKRR